MSVPTDLQSRLSSLFNRMTSRGVTEPMDLYMPQTQNNGQGVPIARPRQKIGTITVHVTPGAGTEAVAQEGQRYSVIDQVYFVNDGSGTLTDANYTELWAILPQRDNAFRRITYCKTEGPYIWAQLEGGATADAAGNIK